VGLPEGSGAHLSAQTSVLAVPRGTNGVLPAAPTEYYP
jgi:hypothetical protein